MTFDLKSLIHIVFSLALTCGLTILIEYFIVKFFNDHSKWKKPVIVCNIISNPILNLILPAIFSFAIYSFGYNATGIILYYVFLLILEIGVVFLEVLISGIMLEMKFTKRLAGFAILNASSFFLGLLFDPMIYSLLFLLRN